MDSNSVKIVIPVIMVCTTRAVRQKLQLPVDEHTMLNCNSHGFAHDQLQAEGLYVGRTREMLLLSTHFISFHFILFHPHLAMRMDASVFSLLIWKACTSCTVICWPAV